MEDASWAIEFEADFVGRLDEAQALTGYSFRGIRELVAARGGVGAAVHLLDLANLGSQHEGFKVLKEADLLRNSLEQTVLDWADKNLFPRSTIATAKARLILARRKNVQE